MPIRLEVSDGHKADARPVPPGSSRVGREQPCTDGESSSGGSMLKTIDSINFGQNSLTKAASRQRSSALSRRSRAWPRLSAYFDSRITKARRLACAQEKSATARVCIKLLRRPEGTKCTRAHRCEANLTAAAVSAIAHREYGQLGHRAASRPTAEAQAAVRAGSGSARASEPLRLYGVREMQGDKFAGGFHADEWPRNGIIFKPSAKTTSENYLHALPMLVVGTCALFDYARLRYSACGSSAMPRRWPRDGHACTRRLRAR
jgi:hypothetical protein